MTIKNYQLIKIFYHLRLIKNYICIYGKQEMGHSY